MRDNKQRELLGLGLQQLTDLVARYGQPDYRAKQLYEALYRRRITALEHVSTLPKAWRSELGRDGFEVGLPQIEKRFVSSDGTVRYLIAFADGQSVETVWMPEGDGGEAGDGSDAGDESLLRHPERTSRPESSGDSVVGEGSQTRAQRATGFRATICVSSQIGCAVNCKFCMTALLGVQRNLTAGEIVGQILAVLNDHDVKLESERINLVFMGQGEPFLNYENFMQAVKLLVDGVGIPESRMTVSTSGIVPRIEDFGSEPVRPKLAISLNGSNDEVREQVMPINRKWDIAKLLSVLRSFPLRNRERLTFEYVLLADVNDTERNAAEMAELLRGLRAKVNLIALNPGPEIPFTMPTENRVLRFQKVLIDAGIPTFVRRPRGRDIYAACGQLKRTTELVSLGP